MENFDILTKTFDILKSSIQSIQNPAFSYSKCIYIKYICMLIISSWLCPKCTFILLYTTLNLEACKINNRKKCVTFLRGGGGSPEERPHDVSRGQNNMRCFP